MKKRRRRRRRRIRLTKQGYLALLALVLLLLVAFGIRVLVVSCNYNKPDAGNAKGNGSTSGGAVAGKGDAAITPELPAETPAFTPSPTPTATQQLATTGSRLPTKEEEAGAVEGVIRTSDVALRRGPGQVYDKIYKYKVGERVMVYAREDDYYLVKILSDERYGFMSVDFITRFGNLPEDTAATPVPTVAPGTVMGLVNVQELKLRSVPSTSGNTPLGVCTENALLWIYYQSGEFYYVEVAGTGQRGYVFAEYVMTRGDVPQGTPQPGA